MRSISWQRMTGSATELPNGFVTASELPINAHLHQAALQPLIDNSTSKTINVPKDT
jgi:ribonucleotide reductase alpha subunit